jgi:hypothetical protein
LWGEERDEEGVLKLDIAFGYFLCYIENIKIWIEKISHTDKFS